jgi:hypothetical protein
VAIIWNLNICDKDRVLSMAATSETHSLSAVASYEKVLQGGKARTPASPASNEGAASGEPIEQKCLKDVCMSVRVFKLYARVRMAENVSIEPMDTFSAIQWIHFPPYDWKSRESHTSGPMQAFEGMRRPIRR